MSEVKPIFEGWPSGDVLRLHDGYRERGIVVLRTEDWEHCKQQMAQLENLKADVEREMAPDAASEGPSGANETGFVPPVCPTHKVQMVLSFYQRGPNDPPGNGWSCPECVEERKTEAVEASESRPAEQPFTGLHWDALVSACYATITDLTKCCLELREQVELQNERIERLEKGEK